MLNVFGLLVNLYTVCMTVSCPNISFAADFNYMSSFVSL